MTSKEVEQRNIILQQRIYYFKDKIYKSIELIQKGNTEKALKLLRKVLYEK